MISPSSRSTSGGPAAATSCMISPTMPLTSAKDPVDLIYKSIEWFGSKPHNVSSWKAFRKIVDFVKTHGVKINKDRFDPATQISRLRSLSTQQLIYHVTADMPSKAFYEDFILGIIFKDSFPEE